MVILSTSTSEQTFNCIPRGAFDTMTILDEQNNTTETVAITDIVYGDYVTAVSAEFTLLEGRFYSLTLLNGTDVMFKDKLFCTDKALVNFSVNDGQYISNATQNTFIVYE
jgi:hypothetical protein